MTSLEAAGVSVQRVAALRAAAERARRTNYAIYSGFVVLAAVETERGCFGGSNVEIANYSLTKHAEETAVLAAITAGSGPQGPWLTALYVTAPPCGSCRQFVAEFALPGALVLIDRLDRRTVSTSSLRDLPVEGIEVWRLGELLPALFSSAAVLSSGS